MASGNPIAGMLARQLVGKLAAGRPAGQGSAPAPLGPPQPADQAGQQVSQQLSELNNADPQSTAKLLQQMKSMTIALYTRAAFQMPDVANNLAQMQKYLDKALEAVEKAAQTAQTVQSPIVNNAGISNPLQQGQSGAGDQGNPSLPGLQAFAQGA